MSTDDLKLKSKHATSGPDTIWKTLKDLPNIQTLFIAGSSDLGILDFESSCQRLTSLRELRFNQFSTKFACQMLTSLLIATPNLEFFSFEQCSHDMDKINDPEPDAPHTCPSYAT